MVNPQRSGWRSEIRLCRCGVLELERSVFVICQPTSGGLPMAKYYCKGRLRATRIL